MIVVDAAKQGFTNIFVMMGDSNLPEYCHKVESITGLPKSIPHFHTSKEKNFHIDRTAINSAPHK